MLGTYSYQNRNWDIHLLTENLPDPSLTVSILLAAFCVPTFEKGPARSKSYEKETSYQDIVNLKKHITKIFI